MKIFIWTDEIRTEPLYLPFFYLDTYSLEKKQVDMYGSDTPVQGLMLPLFTRNPLNMVIIPLLSSHGPSQVNKCIRTEIFN